MTYNILGEHEDHLGNVLAAVKAQSPDFLAIQEANFFPKDDNRYLRLFSQELGLPFYEISLAGEYDYHVASFSKYPFKRVNKLPGFRNACLQTDIEIELGMLSVFNTHLTPYTEDDRLREIEILLTAQGDIENRIILGDLNSLSPDDGYDLNRLDLNESQKKKFTKNGELQFEVIRRLKAAGFRDTMLEAGENHQTTVPTPVNRDVAHGDMRLDYILVTDPLGSKVKKVEVVKNELTNKASDHYPVLVELA